jgi:hypothetical protein
VSIVEAPALAFSLPIGLNFNFSYSKEEQKTGFSPIEG